MLKGEKWKWKVSLSVVSDSLWPHGLLPARLLCPWDFPGKSTEKGRETFIALYFCVWGLDWQSQFLHRLRSALPCSSCTPWASELITLNLNLFIHNMGMIETCLCSVTKSCLTLYNPMDCSLPGSSIHGIFQARVVEWVAIAFSVDFSRYRQLFSYHFFFNLNLFILIGG